MRPGAHNLTNGRGEPTTSPQLYLLDSSGVCSVLRDRVFQKAVQFYENGASIREISRTMDIPKTTLKDNLKKLDGQSAQKILPKESRAGTAPYGYRVHKGQLVLDETESKIVKVMRRHWQSGKSFRAIADVLNRQQIKTRNAKLWDHSVIRTILSREKIMKTSAQ